jgi:ssDNA-binding Zn-finger/Zn-ribbon topoisomerase 1
MSKEFIVCGIDQIAKEISISDDENLSNAKCQVCHCPMIYGSGPWGGYSKCPNCNHVNNDYYSDEKKEISLKHTIKTMEEELSFFKNVLETVSNKNSVRELNDSFIIKL